jgi:hypothetical protein
MDNFQNWMVVAEECEAFAAAAKAQVNRDMLLAAAARWRRMARVAQEPRGGHKTRSNGPARSHPGTCQPKSTIGRFSARGLWDRRRSYVAFGKRFRPNAAAKARFEPASAHQCPFGNCRQVSKKLLQQRGGADGYRTNVRSVNQAHPEPLSSARSNLRPHRKLRRLRVPLEGARLKSTASLRRRLAPVRC